MCINEILSSALHSDKMDNWRYTLLCILFVFKLQPATGFGSDIFDELNRLAGGDEEATVGQDCYGFLNNKVKYTGKKHTDVNGVPCQRWDEQTPVAHDFTEPDMFPEASLAMVENFCRDPNDSGFPWCYTVDPDIPESECGLPQCKECYTVIDGTGIYVGTKSTTELGTDCQRWDEQYPHTHESNNPDNFPYGSLARAANYCRDPDKTGHPWCYTTNPSIRRMSCGIPSCSDPCLSNPCKNERQCISDGDTFKCDCGEDTYDEFCETDPCLSSPCKNERLCIPEGDTFSCDCGDEYTGDLCETVVGPCTSNPCHNGNPCVPDETGFTCECSDEYSGTLCEKVVLPCDKQPCERGYCRNGAHTFFCICPRGFKGERCEIFNPCYSSPCKNGGNCTGYGTTFRCGCGTKFTGQLCENDVNECLSYPCQNGGTCKNRRGTYNCQCRGGFAGQNCQMDYNPCKKNRCLDPGTRQCIPDGWKFTCSCFNGSSGKQCERLSTEIQFVTEGQAQLEKLYDFGYKMEGFPNTILFMVKACKDAILSIGINNNFREGFYKIILGTEDNTLAKVTKLSADPIVKPKTCIDIKELHLGFSDGDYWLYPDGVDGEKIFVYCFNMTGIPTEYITLYVNNIGMHPDIGNPNCTGEGTSINAALSGNSSFSKIRVDVKTMQVIRDDYTFAATWKTPVPYGEPGDCYTEHANGVRAECGVKGYFNIDLTGTGLIVDKTLTWSDYGNGSYAEMDRSEDGTIINLRCGGMCGYCKPDMAITLKINILQEYTDAVVLNETMFNTLDCNHARMYWVSWTDGKSIEVGRGSIAGKGMFLKATEEALMPMNYVGIQTLHTTGYWNFNPCHCYTGKCVVKWNKFECSCPYGFSGTYCENSPRRVLILTPMGEIITVKETVEVEITKNATEVLYKRQVEHKAKLDARPRLTINESIEKNTALVPVINLVTPVDFGPDSTRDIDIDAILGINPGRKKRHIRKRQAPGQKRVIEILMVVDYAACKKWLNWMDGDVSAAIDEMNDYYTSMLYTVSLRLASITGMEVELWLARLLLANTSDASSWTTATEVNGTVDTQTVLMAFTRWIFDNMHYLPKHDHAMLLTGYDFSLNGNTMSAGRAWDCRMCQTHSISVLEETRGQTMAVIAAHELGHSLCAFHDGKGNDCSSSDGYTMANIVKIPKKSMRSHPWKYSPCTAQAIKAYLNGSHGDCTLDNNEEYSGLNAFSDTPLGQKFTHDIQCEMVMGNKSSLCRILFYNNPDGGFTNLCHNMLCSDPNSTYCFSTLAQDGTACGHFKWCQQGRCVMNLTHGPDVYDRCPAGDDPNTACNRTGICNNFIFRDILCCKTCLDRAAAAAATVSKQPTTTEHIPTGPVIKTFPNEPCPANITWLYTGNNWMLKWSCPKKVQWMRRQQKKQVQTGRASQALVLPPLGRASQALVLPPLGRASQALFLPPQN